MPARALRRFIAFTGGKKLWEAANRFNSSRLNTIADIVLNDYESISKIRDLFNAVLEKKQKNGVGV